MLSLSMKSWDMSLKVLNSTRMEVRFQLTFTPHPYNDDALAPHQLLVHRLQVDDDYKP